MSDQTSTRTKARKHSAPPRPETKPPRIVCLVQGGILQQVLADTSVLVYHVDQDKHSRPREIRRLYQAELMPTQVDEWFAEPVTADDEEGAQ